MTGRTLKTPNSTKRSNKYKIDRRIGANLLGSPRSAFLKNPAKPGDKKTGRETRPSEYALANLELQKTKHFYGRLRTGYIKKTIKDALKIRGRSDENLMYLLESRLSSIVYRARFTASPFSARQLVGHGHVTVNGKKVDIPSYRVKTGDIISIAPDMRDNKNIVTMMNSQERNIASYLNVNGYDCTVKEKITFENVIFPTPIKFSMLIEKFAI